MAIQVRLDLAPAEFDLVRRALTAYRAECWQHGEDAERHSQERRDAKAEVLRVDDLSVKLNA